MTSNSRQGRDPGAMKMIDDLYAMVPSFTDVFDEETFYICMGLVCMTTILAAFIASRFIIIKPVD